MEELDQTIKTELSKLNERFEPNELAYLALTGKVELCLRDRLVWRLQTKFSPLGLQVAREWGVQKPDQRVRIDAAILQEQKPVVFLEFKAMVTFDCTEAHSNPHQFPELMLADLQKMKRAADAKTTLYSILFGTHPLDPIPDSRKSTVKYAASINKALQIYGRSERVREACERTIDAFFRPKNLPMSLPKSLPAGQCFDVRTEVLYWIVGPLLSESLPSGLQ